MALTSLHPEYGARLVLERDPAEAGVGHQLRVYEPEDVLHEGRALLDGAFALTWVSTPPEWAVTFLERLLAGLAKKHAEDGSFPRKLTRWREPR
ncbi:MAG TPA: hypothetical protein DEF51_30270 [Myxococcales bacterium]|nr:hypothetical protein [Myxococcales bacterium]